MKCSHVQTTSGRIIFIFAEKETQSHTPYLESRLIAKFFQDKLDKQHFDDGCLGDVVQFK